MTTPTGTKIGLISFAHMHALSYVNALQALGVGVAGIYDEDEARGREMAERFGTRFFGELDALLAENLDGVIICSENVNHRPHVEATAERVPHILCEKPIATTVEDAQAMISACERAGSKLQIAFPVRFAPPVQKLKALLGAGSLGRLISTKCTNHGRLPGGWFVDKEKAGGGAVIDHTVHVIDVLRWALGAEVTEVYAEVGYGLLHDTDTPIDDAGMLSFSLDNGVYGTLDTSWSRPENYPIWGDVTLEILGERGLVRVDAFKQTLTLTSAPAQKSEWVSWGSDADQGLIQDFLEMIQTGREPSVTGADGLRALEVALAAYRSAGVQKPVSLRAQEAA
jgi:predicted dehydrogenase